MYIFAGGLCSYVMSSSRNFTSIQRDVVLQELVSGRQDGHTLPFRVLLSVHRWTLLTVNSDEKKKSDAVPGFVFQFRLINT